MKRLNTLEDFLEHSCGMTSTLLVLHYEEHRDWIESCLTTYLSLRSNDEYEEHVEDLWITLPEPPKEFFYHGGSR